MKGFTLIFLIAIFPLQAEPWGKDADLASKKTCLTDCSPPCIQTPLLGPLGEILIHFHQSTISPADGPRSNYIPSSSQYTLDAMRKYGFFKGFAMGCDRLMRENSDPWVYRTVKDGNGKIMKWDPVP